MSKPVSKPIRRYPLSFPKGFSEARQLLTLALPIIIAQLIQMSLGLVDTMMVGRLDGATRALASMAVAGSFFGILMMIANGIIMALGSFVAQAEGASDSQKRTLFTQQSFYIAFIISLIIMPLLQNGAYILEHLLKQDPEVSRLAGGYLWAMSWGALGNLWLMVLRNFLEGIAKTRPIVLITIVGLIANVVFNTVLMFGYWGFPALGLVGTGWASALVYWLMFLAGLGYIHIVLKDYRFLNLGLPKWGAIKELLKVGLPIGISLGFEAGLFATITFLMGQFSQDALAASEIALRTASASFMVPLGIASAIAVRVGQALGRHDKEAMQRTGTVGMILAVGFMGLMGLCYWLFPRAIIGLYIDISRPELQNQVLIAMRFFAFVAMFQIVDGLQVSAFGALRGLKDTRVPMIITAFSYWVLGLGSAILLAFYFNMEGSGLWLGLAIGLSAAGLLLRWRFYQHFRQILPPLS
ncbi:MAG: MATE family efflux transporter [Deinococcales bacterium]